MKRFKNILVVCDEHSAHDELIGRAIALAKANHARVTLADVVEAAPGALAKVYGALPGARAHEIEFEVIEFHRARLAQLAGGRFDHIDHRDTSMVGLRQGDRAIDQFVLSTVLVTDHEDVLEPLHSRTRSVRFVSSSGAAGPNSSVQTTHFGRWG